MTQSSQNKDAIAVAIEVDGRQKYLFETDKIQEMLGASRIMAIMVKEAENLFKKSDGLFLFSPVSGEIRAWAKLDDKVKDRDKLLNAAWKLREWLDDRGVPHSVAFLETRSGHFEQSGDEKADCILDDNGEPKEPKENDLSWVHWALGERIRKCKDAKSGEDARPRCSLFASCRLHGTDAATRWLPDEASRKMPRPQADIEENETRRHLSGWRAGKKREIWWQERAKLVKENLEEPLKKRLLELGFPVPSFDRTWHIHDYSNPPRRDDLPVAQDSYVAWVCGDGDGMGDLLSNLHWNTSVWGEDGFFPWQRNREFSMKFDTLVHDAFAKAAYDSLLPTPEAAAEFLKTKLFYLPYIPVLLGGDDLWLVGEKEAVLETCRNFIAKYETLAGNCSEFPILVRALEIAQPRLDKKRSDAAAKQDKTPESQPALRLTISLGIAFAKASHPAHDMVLIAESLMKSAKRLRKGEVPTQRQAPNPYKGCLDWHWVESSKSEEIKEARSKGWMYNGSNGETMLLTTRPWTHEEAAKFSDAAVEFQKVPRRKREQLEDILRLGKTLGDLAWKSWWDGLKKDERQRVSDAVALLGVWSPKVDKTPWKDKLGKAKRMLNNQEVEVDVYATPFIDLLALQHVLGLEGAGKKTHTDSSDSQQGRQS